MKARIYKPSKTAMQSGRAKTKAWVLEYELASPREAEPLMGWVSSGDTLNQVKIKFETLEEAKAFASEKGLEFSVLGERKRVIKPRNYGDNFRYFPPEDAEKA